MHTLIGGEEVRSRSRSRSHSRRRGGGVSSARRHRRFVSHRFRGGGRKGGEGGVGGMESVLALRGCSGGDGLNSIPYQG